MGIQEIGLILVPTDFSPGSHRALEVAIELAHLTAAKLDVLHVNTDDILPPTGDVMAAPVDLTEMLATSVMELETMVARVRAAGIQCSAASNVGPAAAEIVAYARTHAAGLIVVGSHGGHGVGHLFVGSVAEKVVRSAPCPILVVPPPDEPAPRVRSEDDTPTVVPIERPAK